MKFGPKGCSKALVLVAVSISISRLLAGDPPEPPKLSTVAPAAELTQQARLYLAGFNEALADEQKYTEKKGAVTRDAHTLTLLALVLAKHDTDHELKSASPALMKASQELAAAPDYAAAKAALAAVESAAGGSATEVAELKWEKVASLGQAMKQVTLVSNRLKRGLRRFEDRAEENARDAAVLAAIAQAVTYDTHEVKNPDDVDKWYQFCSEMRDAAGQLNTTIKAADKDGAGAAMSRLSKNCDSCHEVFRPEE